MKTRPKGMDYGTYKAMCAAGKESPMSEDEFKALPVGGDEPDADDRGGPPDGDADDQGGGEPAKDDDEEEDGEEREEKSLGLADLRKSLAAFDGVVDAAQVAGGGSRETYLKARLDNGTITKSERTELGRIWAGEVEDQPTDPNGRLVRKSLESYLDDDSRQVVNAAPVLKSLLGGVQDRLDAVTTRTEAGQEATRQLVLAQGSLMKSLCGAVLEMSDQLARRDAVIKALETRLGTVERTPAQPRAVRTGNKGQARPIAKSVQGGGSGDNRTGGDGLNKAQVLAGFNRLVKGAGDGNDFGTAQRLSIESATYERTGHLSPGTRAAIEAVMGVGG